MWAADSVVMWAAIPLRCGPHLLFHRNRGPHGVIVAHIEWNGGPEAPESWPTWNVIVARMKRNGEIGPVGGASGVG